MQCAEARMIKINELTKNFEDICAVNHVSITVPDGVMFGLPAYAGGNT